VVDSLKVLDLKWPIREADIRSISAIGAPGERGTSLRRWLRVSWSRVRSLSGS
jgi:hypothetical protein